MAARLSSISAIPKCLTVSDLNGHIHEMLVLGDEKAVLLSHNPILSTLAGSTAYGLGKTSSSEGSRFFS